MSQVWQSILEWLRKSRRNRTKRRAEICPLPGPRPGTGRSQLPYQALWEKVIQKRYSSGRSLREITASSLSMWRILEGGHVKIVRNKAALLVSVLLMLGLGLNSAHATTTTTLSEKNASKTVAVKLGARVELTLHSMYWGLAVPAKSSSLISKGQPILKPIFPSPSAPTGCKIAGSGCGTQTWEFVATKVGITRLVASRTTCGEAMKCTSATGRFTVKIIVSR